MTIALFAADIDRGARQVRSDGGISNPLQPIHPHPVAIVIAPGNVRSRDDLVALLDDLEREVAATDLSLAP